MKNNMIAGEYADIQTRLKTDCTNCSGLCCVALYCTKTDGFPANKEAGVPCKHLTSDFRCDIHSELVSKKLRGCLAYDCFGAGQKVTQSCYPSMNWNASDRTAEEMFRVFSTVFQLHQMEWYLLEALSLSADDSLDAHVEALIAENERITSRSPEEILRFDMEGYRANVNHLLRQVSKMMAEGSSDEAVSKDYIGRDLLHANLNGKDLSMALLIAANLEGCSLVGTNFLGADMRDANIKNTDISSGIFLTQMQINSAKGNANTKLPASLTRPISWDCKP